jgi:hypothetical protein
MAKNRQKRHSADFSSNYDPNGSYTGISKDGLNEKPVQDADDL